MARYFWLYLNRLVRGHGRVPWGMAKVLPDPRSVKCVKCELFDRKKVIEEMEEI